MVNTLLSSFLKHPKKAEFEGEDKDEVILYVLRQNFITNFDWIAVLLLILYAPSVLSFFTDFIGFDTGTLFNDGFSLIVYIFWYVFAFGFGFVNFLNWFFNTYIISSKRIIDMDFHGFLYRNISEAPLRNIEDITHNISGVPQTIFNYGDVVIQTAGERREFDFHSVTNPIKVQDIISDLVSEVKHGY